MLSAHLRSDIKVGLNPSLLDAVENALMDSVFLREIHRRTLEEVVCVPFLGLLSLVVWGLLAQERGNSGAFPVAIPGSPHSTVASHAKILFSR